MNPEDSAKDREEARARENTAKPKKEKKTE